MIDPAVGYLIVCGAAALFGSAAAHKLRALPEFAGSLAAYRVLPGVFARRWAWIVPCVEAAIALAIVLPRWRVFGALAGCALLISYAAAIALNLARGRSDLDCGCGGPGSRRPIGTWMVWRNMALCAVLGAIALPWDARPLGPVDALTVIGGWAAGGLLYRSVDRLAGEIAPKGRLIGRAA